MSAGGQGLNWKIGTVVLVLVFGVLTLVPNFVEVGDKWFLSKDKIKYGLDIQGGLHLVMGVDVRGVIKEKLDRTGDTLKQELVKENVTVTSLKTDKGADFDTLTMTFASLAEVEKASAYISKNYYYMQQVDKKDSSLVFKFIDTYIFETKKNTLEQAIETIRNRIDEFGVSEPSITAQGEDRILVQLPGLKEAQKAKDLINRTARLEFMIVSQKGGGAELQQWIEEAEKAGNYSLQTMKYSDYVRRINDDLKAKLPPQTVVKFQKAENIEKMELGKVPYLLESSGSLAGDSIKDAFVTPGEFNEPEVALHFNADGANRFAEITGNNVNRLMAIVLDDVVYSAPNIKQKISGGSARITLGGSRDYNGVLEEAKMIAMALRAGALPARLEELEERTVGPSLGADSIAKGKKAAFIGALLVVAFMIVFYKTFGIISNIALAVNILLLVAILSALEATLTLPGIAGIALTMGMAVDANVIINERIKEELARGASFAASVREGYAKALTAILDSNLTTAATSVILFYFGTGPVRGFAVTLLIGIVTTMFANVWVSQVICEFLIGKLKVKKMAI